MTACINGCMRSTERQSYTKFKEEVLTFATGLSSLDLGKELDGLLRIGCWITDDDEIRDLNPMENRLPVDVMFILE